MAHQSVEVVLLALCIVAGAQARQYEAEAPSPGRAHEHEHQKPTADLLFILSADAAMFPTADTLTLENVSATSQFYSKGARAGIVPTGAFVNSSAGAKYVSDETGQWLNSPTATLFGYDSNSHDRSVVMTLASPTANPANRTVTFNVTIMPNGTEAIKTRKGVANHVEEEARTVANFLVTNVQPGAMLSDVALFVDSDSGSLGPEADSKAYWHHHGLGRHWGGRDGGYNRGSATEVAGK